MFTIVSLGLNPVTEKPTQKTTWHRILSFSESNNKWLQTLQKGSKVYVEAAYELKEPDPEADPSTPNGQRQIFLRHGTSSCNNLPMFS